MLASVPLEIREAADKSHSDMQSNRNPGVKVSRLVTSAAATASVQIHSSQFPQNVRRELVECLRRRDINPKFHYESIKQAAKWLKLHQTHAPSQKDKDCRATYQCAFENA